MAVGGRRGVDRVLQTELPDDLRGAEVEELGHLIRNLTVLQAVFRGSVGVHEHAHGLRHADRVGELDEALVRHAGGDEVLCDVAGGIGRAAVHLGRVLAGESTAAMGALAAVGVDDDLAAGEAGVAVGAADDELPGGVHMQDEAVDEARGLLREGGLQARDEDGLHIVADLRLHLEIDLGLAELADRVGVGHPAEARRDELVVLRGKDDGMDLHGLVRVPVILDGELGLGVRAEVRHQLRLLVADVGQDLQQEVAEVQGQRHIVLGVAAGVAEHHALVAGALVIGLGALHAAVDVGALLVQGGHHAAGVPVEHVLGLVVADAVDGVADGGLDIDIGFGLDLAHHHDHARGAEALARDLGFGVLAEELVQDGVADLVGHFVGMAFGNRFGGE